MSTARRTALVVLALSAVPTAGCGGRGDEAEQLSGDIAQYRPTGNGGDAALLVGELVREDGCTYLRTATGETYLPIFPADAVWRDDAVQSGDERYPRGATVGLGGSVGEREVADHVPDGCADDVPGWIVAQP